MPDSNADRKNICCNNSLDSFSLFFFFWVIVIVAFENDLNFCFLFYGGYCKAWWNQRVVYVGMYHSRLVFVI